jgi:N-acetylmuramoyl-L-alanine amidase
MPRGGPGTAPAPPAGAAALLAAEPRAAEEPGAVAERPEDRASAAVAGPACGGAVAVAAVLAAAFGESFTPAVVPPAPQAPSAAASSTTRPAAIALALAARSGRRDRDIRGLWARRRSHREGFAGRGPRERLSSGVAVSRLSHRRKRLLPVALASALSLALGCGATATTAVRPVAVAPSTTSTAPATGGSAPTVPAESSPAVPPAPPPPHPRLVLGEPHVISDPIPFGAERKAQMVAYARRHYGSFMTPTYRLENPRVIVIHYTETPSFQATYNTFAPDTPDPELHELPNTCAHFVIDKAGAIHQLVPLGIMCRHTVGLNWTAIGVEHVADSDGEVLQDSAQMRASLRLVRWLRCRYHIAIRNVIGHNESLSSPYHREDVPALRAQTHSDFNHLDMQVYRRRLGAAGGCA